MATCPAVPIWLLPASELGFTVGAPGNRLQPLPPRSTVFESIPAADFKKKVGQPEGDPFAILFVAAEVRPERVKVSSFVPQPHIALPPYHAKTGHLCEPIASRISEIALAAETGQKDRRGRSIGATLPTPPPFASEPRIDSTGWRATALKPFQPLPSEPLPVVFRAQAGSSVVVRTKTALRELCSPFAATVALVGDPMGIDWMGSILRCQWPSRKRGSVYRIRPGSCRGLPAWTRICPATNSWRSHPRYPLSFSPCWRARAHPYRAPQWLRPWRRCVPGLNRPLRGVRSTTRSRAVSPSTVL